MNRTPIFLAVETAARVGSAAAVSSDKCSLKTCGLPDRHSETIIPLADQALSDIGARLADCSAVAFGAGPGAFTGLRVACGVAQGLAWGAGLPVVAVCNLEALAMRILAAEPVGTMVLVAVDARMGQAYGAVYGRADDARPVEVAAPRLLDPAGIAPFGAENGAALAAGNALAEFADKVPVDGFRRVEPDAMADALDVARLAAVLFDLGLAVAPPLAAPLYVRNRVALTTRERQEGARL